MPELRPAGTAAPAGARAGAGASVWRWRAGALVLLCLRGATGSQAAAPNARTSMPVAAAASAASAPAGPLAEPPALLLPVQGMKASELRDTFGDRRGGDEPRGHEAIDMLAPIGTPVLAAGDGRIVKLFLSKPGGITVYQFDPSGQFAYYYAHLERYADGLAEGQSVKRGALIGYVGATGNARVDAPHLHFAIFRLGPEKQWWKGEPVNPFGYLGGRKP